MVSGRVRTVSPWCSYGGHPAPGSFKARPGAVAGPRTFIFQKKCKAAGELQVRSRDTGLVDKLPTAPRLTLCDVRAFDVGLSAASACDGVEGLIHDDPDQRLFVVLGLTSRTKPKTLRKSRDKLAAGIWHRSTAAL